MQYSYQAVDRQGKSLHGKLEAQSSESVIITLRDQGVFVTKLWERKGLHSLTSPSKNSILSLEIHFGRIVKGSDFAVFTRQLATLMKAGVTVADGVRVLAQQTERKAFAKALDEVAGQLRNGSQLSEAAAERSNIFPPLFVNMIRAGEASGNLDDVLEKLAIFYEKEHYTSEKIKSAMTYPLIVGVLAVAVVFILMTTVIPTFVGLFASFHTQLPLATRIVMGASHFFVQFWYLMIILIVTIIVSYVLGMRKESARYVRDVIFLKLPVFGPLLQKSAIARMARTMGSLFASSVPILQSLKLTADAVENEVVARALLGSAESLIAGEPLSEPLSKSWVFPPLVVHMIMVGEQTGNLDFMLSKIADFYEAETEAVVDRLKTLIEPLMIVILTSIVGTIIIAVISPMFSIYQQMGNLGQ